MLTKPLEAISMAEIYNIPPEDILFLDLSICGIAVNLPYLRVRFEFIPEYKSYFKNSFSKGITQYFFALPTNGNSPYQIEKGYLIAKGEKIGQIKHLSNDTCDFSYPRRKGTVLNLNPISKSKCRGCKFCHTLLQEPNDINEDLQSEGGLKRFIGGWLKKYNLSNLSHLIQVVVVTGCFGKEQKVIEYLKRIRSVFNEYNFNGELFYYGSEITTKEALEELKGIKNFALCLSLDCFENRKTMLKNVKGKITIKDAKVILQEAKEKGFRTNFSYILGIEPLEIIQKVFNELLPYINSFPVINIFQVHHGQEKLRHPNAWKIDYYMKARKIFEKMFINTNMRPRVWENYRSLWYLKFGEEWLDDIRTP